MKMVWLAELSNAVLKNDLTYVDSCAGAPSSSQPQTQKDIEPEAPRRSALPFALLFTLSADQDAAQEPREHPQEPLHYRQSYHPPTQASHL